MENVLIVNLNGGLNPDLINNLYREFNLIVDNNFNDHFPVDSVIISPGFSGSTEESIKQLFLCLKELYPLVMQNKGMNIWVVEPQFPEATKTIDKNCFLEGIKSMTKLAAMELSSKAISVNFLSKNKNGFEGISEFISWSRKRKKIFLTAQVIN